MRLETLQDMVEEEMNYMGAQLDKVIHGCDVLYRDVKDRMERFLVELGQTGYTISRSIVARMLWDADQAVRGRH